MKKKSFKEAEFCKFDWSRLITGAYATNGDNYSFSKGGPGYPGGSGWLICIHLDNDEVEEWALPEALSRFIDWAGHNGKKEKMSEIRNMLGL